VKDACRALEISRSGYYTQPFTRKVEIVLEVRDRDLLEVIKIEHPFCGYRRVRVWLVHPEEIRVNEKRVRRVMKQNGLMMTQTVHEAKRTPQRSKPKAERSRQYWGIDMTKFMIPVLGWVYLVIVLDWYTKKIVGWDLSLREPVCGMAWGFRTSDREGVPSRGKGSRIEAYQW
jgi:putative transposase